MKILQLIDTFDSGDSARQLQILGPALGNDASVEICCLGPETPRLTALRQSGIAAHALHWTRWFDPSVFMSLRALLRESAPDVIHVWGLRALRTLTLCAADYLPRVVLSSEFGKLTWWDQRLLQRVCCASAVPPALDTKDKRCQDPFSIKGPDTFFRIACLEPSYRHAIWTFDFVRLLFPDAMLHIVGAGAEHAVLANLMNCLECTASVRIHDVDADARDVVQDAAVVWIPSLTNRGQQTALECMALGRAVIASDVPCLRQIIDDGVTGCLIAPGDVVQLARRARILLDDARLRIRLGAAAREFVIRQFPLERTVEHWRELYRRVAA